MPDISPYLIISFITVIVCQIVRFAVHGFSNELDFKKLVSAGGLPSSLSAVIVALAITALAVDGLSSSITGLTIVFGFVAMDLLLAHTNLKNRLNSKVESVKDLPDHSMKDLGFGALIGLISSTILSVSYWKDDFDWFFEVPAGNEVKTWFIVFGVILVVAEILCFMTRRKNMRKLPTSRKLNRAFRLSLTLPAIIGLIITFAQQQTLGMLDSRIWTYLVVDWIILASIWFWYSVYRHARPHLAEERAHFKTAKVKEKKKRTKSKKKKRK